MNNVEELTGTIERCIFKSTDTGFSVFVLSLRNNKSIIVTGNLPNIQPGQQITVKGDWFMHPKFGRQFKAATCITELPSNVIGIKKYLGSGLIKGIGKVYAEKLVNHFGAETLEIIDKSPERLNEVGGIGPKRLKQIIQAWGDQREISSIMVFLQERDVSTAFASKIYKQYGKESLAVLNENPYRLAEDIWGVGFKSADQLAQKMGLDPASVKRIKAGLLFAISEHANQGHLYIELSALKEKTANLLELNQEEHAASFKTALYDLYHDEKIKLITHNNEHFLTLSLYYFSEKNIGNKLRKLNEQPSSFTFNLDAIYNHISKPSPGSIALNEEQQKGIMASVQNKVTVITGGPGTGKTTLIKKLLEILNQHKLRYKLAAPTGRAAKRITEGTGRHASTLHRLLDFDVSTMRFKHNEQNALSLDFLIIDEASMIDVFLANAILKALPLNAHVVFIGDIDQLPSVGAGNILNDMIASGVITSIRLQHIFRQAQDSLIIVNAHRINKGEFPTSNLPNAKKDFIFIKEQDPANVINHIKSLFSKRLPQMHIKKDDSMVLVPMNRGIVGTHKLNQDLQQFLNPHQTEKQIIRAGTLYKIGDKVMQIRNNYDKKVFNGDIGFIHDMDMEERALSVNFDNRLIEYKFEELDELVLAYAISIHKSQGSEYQAAIIPLFMQHFMLLQRNLIYTAITRAKRFCVFIGQPKALAIGIKNNKSVIRKTFLQEYLTTDLEAR